MITQFQIASFLKKKKELEIKKELKYGLIAGIESDEATKAFFNLRIFLDFSILIDFDDYMDLWM